MVKIIRLALYLGLISPYVLLAQAPQRTPEQDSLVAQTQRKTKADHHKMLDLLGIKEIRQGANGSNPQASNAANYDESKATPYPTLPAILITKKGQKVSTVPDWWNIRRPDIVVDFDREIYGRVPENTPQVNWEIVSTADSVIGTTPVKVKNLIGYVDNSSYPVITVDIQLSLVTPSLIKTPVPIMMELSFVFPPGFRQPASTSNEPSCWQQQLVEKGWGYAILIPTSIQADNGAGLSSGIIGLMNKGKTRKADDWGALRAWAWGASRALDYFESDKAVDPFKVGIEGHSRYGKAAAVAMAYDLRFAIAYTSSSGAGGVKLHRRNYGELVENVAASSEYHWMAGNYIKYAGPLQWSDLPVDSHELVALCAPRPVFIGCGYKGDGWCDAKGMFLAGAYASEVYELLGTKGLPTKNFPPLETTLTDGDIGFRQHAGGHTPAPNWPTFIEFAARYF
jgi:hypothetical protein